MRFVIINENDCLRQICTLKLITNKSVVRFLAVDRGIYHFKAEVHESAKKGTQIFFVHGPVNTNNQRITPSFFLSQFKQVSDTICIQ